MSFVDIPFYVLIALVFGLSMYWLKLKSSQYTNELMSFYQACEQLASMFGSNIDALQPKSKQIANTVCVLESKKTGQFLVHKHGRLLLSKPIEQMLPVPSLSDLKAIPAILTTLGILGTFTGISIGLYQLGSGWEDASQLANQAKELLAGMKTAFFTSIAGMGTSGVFMVCFSIAQAKQAARKAECLAVLQSKVQLSSSNELLHGLLDHATSNQSEQQDLSELVHALKVNADKPSALTATEFQSISEALFTRLEGKVAQVELSLSQQISQNKVDEGKLASLIGEQINVVLRTEVAAPITSELSTIAGDVNQSNNALGTVVELLGEMHDSEKIQQQTLTIEEIKSALQDSVTAPIIHQSNQAYSALNSISESTKSSEETLAKVLAEVDISNQTNTEINQSVQTVSEGIEKLAKARSNEFIHLIEVMGEKVVTPITQELAETNKVVAGFAEVSDKLNQSVVKTVVEMANATKAIESFEQETLTKLNLFAGSMDKSLNEFAINSTRALNSITGEVQNIVKLGNESIKEQTTAFATMVSESRTIFEKQAEAMSTVGKESALLMSTAKTELENGLGDIDRKVSNMSQTVQTELKTFRDEYQENLSDYFDRQNTALDNSLENQKSGLTEVVDKFKHVFADEYKKRSELITELNTQYKQLVDSAERIQTMAKAIGLDRATSLSELQLVEQTLGRQVHSLNKSFSKAAAEFTLVAEKMRPEMDDYFQRANKSVSEYFASFDATSSRIYNRLDRAAELFITAKEEADKAISDAAKISDTTKVKSEVS
ncbi:MotA/TolQ/ExbB proton channel family protein [Photobacterium kagoshimensis]|uniref:MotA/TolQ/ExbB proton channel family protein n=1 Tax=Photobacterium kagoshimensis TaxID=2910242 RepID=UPI003D0FD577